MKTYRKIVIASDSFKGSLSSMQVAEAAESAILELLPACEIVKLPMADGGEGTLRTLVYASHGTMIKCPVHDPLMRPLQAEYGLIDGRAIIEMASASGLTLLGTDERDPLKTSSYGTGEMILHAIKRGYREILVTIGGSATNDAGLGAMQALGLKIYRKDGTPVPDGFAGKDMADVGLLDTSLLNETIMGVNIEAACDVNNPFYGEDGAAHVYAPQKGASAADIITLDNGLRNIAEVIRRNLHIDINSIPGSGAAGGMGGALRALLSAEMKPGVQLVMDRVGFSRHAADADLIITGEGKVDRQTSMGKVVGGIIAATDKPVLVLGGRVENGISYGSRVTIVETSPPSLPDIIAMRSDIAQDNIAKAVRAYLTDE